VEQPPPSSSQPSSEPDLPKPPIWERTTGQVPPIQIRQPGASGGGDKVSPAPAPIASPLRPAPSTPPHPPVPIGTMPDRPVITPEATPSQSAEPAAVSPAPPQPASAAEAPESPVVDAQQMTPPPQPPIVPDSPEPPTLNPPRRTLPRHARDLRESSETPILDTPQQVARPEPTPAALETTRQLPTSPSSVARAPGAPAARLATPATPVAPAGPTFTPAAPLVSTTQPLGQTAVMPTTVVPPSSGASTEKPRKKRVGLYALAALLTAAVLLGGFFLGRSMTSTETVTTPVGENIPTSVTPEAEAEADPDPSPVPATEPVPAASVPGSELPVPPLPGELADEPVAAVAQAVAPAVVLVQNDLGQGSGIIYDEEGLILTNAHVVGQFTEVRITFGTGVSVPGVVLGADPLTDVAVIEIDTDAEFGVAALAPDSSVQVGQLAVAIGSPFGLDQTVTSGIVSAKGRVIVDQLEDGRNSIVAMIQTDAPINPGNSGGALADRQGRVIGMNTSIRTDGSGGNIGVGFAIPADTAKIIADRIVSGEPLEQGFLGVGVGTGEVQEGSPEIIEPGAVIGSIEPGGGAEVAGLTELDRIVRFNGIEIKSMTDLAAAVRIQPPGATVAVEFIRDGELLAVDVTLGILPEAP